MTPPADQALIIEIVERLKAGDQKAQGELIDVIQSRLFKFCLLLSRNKEVAEDLCQEVLLKCLQSIQSLKDSKTFTGWMYQIARNLFIDLKRRPGSKDTLSLEDLTHIGVEKDLDLILNVQKVLSQFEAEDRFMLLLIELEGCSYKEAAEILHISEDAVRSKLHRLRASFVKKYDSGETK
jgi:RNA polymerase sigma-70 factor (ECF subfamily)